jgi:hypothetical protein
MHPNILLRLLISRRYALKRRNFWLRRLSLVLIHNLHVIDHCIRHSSITRSQFAYLLFSPTYFGSLHLTSLNVIANLRFNLFLLYNRNSTETLWVWCRLWHNRSIVLGLSLPIRCIKIRVDRLTTRITEILVLRGGWLIEFILVRFNRCLFHLKSSLVHLFWMRNVNLEELLRALLLSLVYIRCLSPLFSPQYWLDTCVRIHVLIWLLSIDRHWLKIVFGLDQFARRNNT